MQPKVAGRLRRQLASPLDDTGLLQPGSAQPVRERAQPVQGDSRSDLVPGSVGLLNGAQDEDDGVTDGEDVLSLRALEIGIKRIIDMSNGAQGGEMLFSCIALARKTENE